MSSVINLNIVCQKFPANFNLLWYFCVWGIHDDCNSFDNKLSTTFKNFTIRQTDARQSELISSSATRRWHKLEAQGPFTAHLITNSKQFSQKKDNKNEWIQINACVVGNTSVCCCEPLVWRRILSKEKPFRYLFLPRPGSTSWNIWPKPLQEWQHSK